MLSYSTQKTKDLAKKLVLDKFKMRSFNECLYSGIIHTHTINFQFKSCTCRWFMAFGVYAHLVCACDLFNQPLDGYSKPRHFVYRARRGAKKKLLTFFLSKPCLKSKPSEQT